MWITRYQVPVSVLPLLFLGCIGPDDAPDRPGDEVSQIPQEASPEHSAAKHTTISSPPRPSANEPACDDQGSCCPPGTTPVLGTQSDDDFNTNATGLCHVTLGGQDDVNNKSASGLHAALGGPGDDDLKGGHGPSILAGGDGDDSLKSRNSDDELYGQDGNDSLMGQGGHDKGFGGPGDDDINLGDGDNEADGGTGADTINTGKGNDVLRGGSGDDTLNAGGGQDHLHGDLGDDELNGGPGDDVLVGGPGSDQINAGPGHDTVVVFDVCELAPGETLNGGAGVDTLQIPITLAEVLALGVTVQGFEDIVVGADSEASACGSCKCSVSGTELVCCSGHGTCDVEAIDPVGEYPTFLGCDCEDGLSGSDCSYDTAVTFFDDPLPGFCTPDDPGCWFTFDADDECEITFDMLATTDCDDFPSIVKTKQDRTAANQAFTMELCVFYPAADGQENTWADGEFPIWLVNACNGPGCDEGNYEGLLSHVARNGVISVAMAENFNSLEIASRGEMLSCLRRRIPEIAAGNATSIQSHWNGVLAYGGHSRGGEAAVVATQLDVVTLALEPPRAVISMAPTVHCADDTTSCGYGADTIESERGLLTDGSTPAFLVLEGSRDGDGTGGGISLHDVAAAEVADIVSANALIKAMVWAFDVPHHHWEGFPGTLGELLGRTYSVAFLDWHLNGVQSQRSLFVGASVPPCIDNPAGCGYAFPPPPLFPQFREGGSDAGGRRQVVRYFLDDLNTNEGTGPVAGSENAVFVESKANIPREDFRGLSVELTAAPAQSASIELRLDAADVDNPAPLDSLAGSLSRLSFRLSKLLDGAQSVAQGSEAFAQGLCDDYKAQQQNLNDLVVRVTLFDADNGVSSALDTSLYRRVAPPDIGPEKLPGNNNLWMCDVTHFWTTVRIPLADFQGVDLKRLTRVRFELLAPDNGNAAVRALLDSIELVGHVSEPVCGNGQGEPGEQCDGLDLAGSTCEDFGLVSGVLACTDTCEFDTSDCEPPAVCGDGQRELDEACDGPDLGGSTCESFGLISGVLACTNTCEFDTTGCEMDGGDCPEGTPGCPGGPCLEIPASAGVAAYWQEGRYCNDSDYICREDFPGEWTCHDCTSQVDSQVGCPCLPNALECPPELTCVHNLPDLPGIKASARGACWAEVPAGYCVELCEATDRICGSTVEEMSVCLVPECEPNYCEFEPDGAACNRDSSQCEAACDDVDNPCDPDQVCTTWGECWG